MWNPQESATTVDAYKTLFVGRINFDTSESKLRREFESYGAVKKIVMVFNKKTGKPRGYAFVEYEHERDMHSAYKHADGKKIDGRRVVVDIERGRTVQGWLPRRLGGGLGKTRLGGPEVNVKISGRDVDIDRERLFRGEDDRGRDRGRDRDRSSSRPRRDRKEKDKDKRRSSRDRDAKRDKDKDKDRKRRRSKSRSKSRDKKDPEEKEKRRRSRSPREKKKKRSRSRDRDEKKKDKRDREHKKDKKDKDRDKDGEFDLNRVKVKDEPLDDEEYPYEGDQGFGYMKSEKDADYENNFNQYDDGYAAY